MKKYVKPALMALELEADMVLCQGCTINKNNSDLIQQFMDDFSYLDWDKLFAKSDDCAELFPLEGYCKFTGADNERQLFNS